MRKLKRIGNAHKNYLDTSINRKNNTASNFIRNVF